jgi:hypothetical protein
MEAKIGGLERISVNEQARALRAACVEHGIEKGLVVESLSLIAELVEVLNIHGFWIAKEVGGDGVVEFQAGGD